MNESLKKDWEKKVAEEPFAKKFGLKLTGVEEGYAKVEMNFTPDMENLFGMAHGGALFALIDEAFEVASNSHGTMAVALNLNINYLASPEKGSKLAAEAREINRTKKTATYYIEVREDREKLIASCQAQVYRLEKSLPFL
ncbi:MAG TPA: PaaI family thioesterase [Smithella sp.]|nr:PaaI family thioesterase [Smithella sp.]